MINEYRMIYCNQCCETQQHYKHWTCNEYTLCLGCSKAGRNSPCKCFSLQDRKPPVKASEQNYYFSNFDSRRIEQKMDSKSRKISQYYKNRNDDRDD
jgi:hypothetical protein